MPSSLPPIQRLVIRGVNWLGDAVMSTPALIRLREAFPGAHIALLTPRKLADLWLHFPAVDEVITWDASDHLLAVARRLRQGRYDTGLAFPNSHRSALELFLAGIPKRIGYARVGRNWLLTRAVPSRPRAASMRKRSEAEIRQLSSTAGPRGTYPPGSHHLAHYLDLASALGADARMCAPALHITDGEVAGVLQQFGQDPAGGSARPIFGINAGAEYGPAKRWPVERFIEAGREVLRRSNARCWVFGGNNDRAQAEQIATALQTPSNDARVQCVAGKTSLRELCAALKACRCLLTNDTGPMHLAVAVGTPVIALFGSTSPELTGPGLPGEGPHRILLGQAPCAPCFLRECPIDLRCLRSIASADAAGAALELLHGLEP